MFFRFKDDKEITESSRIKITTDSTNNTYTLKINKATAEDEGSYSITASNEINHCSDSCTVTVFSSPKILKSMEKNVEISEGEKIVFNVETSGEVDDSNVKW